MMMRLFAMPMAGMAFGGAFAAGVVFGIGTVALACAAQRMTRRRTDWPPEDHIQGGTAPAPGAAGIEGGPPPL